MSSEVEHSHEPSVSSPPSCEADDIPDLTINEISENDTSKPSDSSPWSTKTSDESPEPSLTSPDFTRLFSGDLQNPLNFLSNEIKEQLGLLAMSVPKKGGDRRSQTSPSTVKRTRRTVPLTTKMEIIEAAKSKTFVAVGRDFQLAESTVRMIVKEKEKYIAANSMYKSAKRIRLTSAKHIQLDKALIIWVDGIRKEHPDYHFDNKGLQDKAREMATILGLKDFKASQGWLSKFKLRHGISPESTKENPEAVKNEWSENLSHLIKHDDDRPCSSSSLHETSTETCSNGVINELLRQILNNNTTTQMYKLSEEESTALAQRAVKAMSNAYCPYSKFEVGAALLGEDGEIYEGVNVESASYPVGTCAERVAIGCAVTKGIRKFKGIAVATRVPDGGSPCGMCRQMLFEFGEYEILLCTPDAKIQVRTSTVELLPRGFGPHHLKAQ